MTKYNKLVRDRIPEIIREKGEECVYHIAGDNEYRIKLSEKLQEEVDEFVKSGSQEELADVLEVIDAIMAAYGFDGKEIVKVKEAKRESNGGFENKVILDES